MENKTENERKLLAAAEDVARALEIENIFFYEYALIVNDSEPISEGEINIDLKLSMAATREGVGYRCGLVADSGLLRISVDAALIYRSHEPVTIRREALKDFGDRAAIMTLYPYIRQAFSDLVAKAPIDTAPLPLVFPGELTFSAEGLDEEIEVQ